MGLTAPRKILLVHLNNEAVTSVLNSGASKDQELQHTLREIALIAARAQFILKARHIAGVDNRIPDWLSRWHEPTARAKFREYSKDKGLRQVRVSCDILEYTHKW